MGKTGATGQTLEEAKKINKSLSALGMVINSLTDGKVGSSSDTFFRHALIAVFACALPRFETHANFARSAGCVEFCKS